MKARWLSLGFAMICLVYPILAADEPNQKPYFYVTCQVFDREGKAVPNANVSVVALDVQGKPYARYGAGSAGSTDLRGRGGFGTGTLPEMKPGKVTVVASHPSIGEISKDVQWSELLHEKQRTDDDKPMYILKADGGPGLDAWRAQATKESPSLVTALADADKPDQIESAKKQIAQREMLAVPALLKVLADYSDPKRQRYVDALAWTWNGCRGIGPLDEQLRDRARAIYDIEMHIAVFEKKPGSERSFVQRVESHSGEYKSYALKEIEWKIGTLVREVTTAERSGNVAEARRLKATLDMLQAELPEMKKAAASMPATAPAKSVTGT